MRDGTYDDSGFPQIGWDDVPALLALADEVKPLTRFPRNPISSQYEESCSEGMVALWLIEGIRKGGKYPSMATLCLPVPVPKGDWGKISEANHNAVAKAYKSWWDRVKSLPPAKAVEDDPLSGTGLAWH
jgi:hypothetical protein